MKYLRFYSIWKTDLSFRLAALKRNAAINYLDGNLVDCGSLVMADLSGNIFHLFYSF
jgi:hypothetical protein